MPRPLSGPRIQQLCSARSPLSELLPPRPDSPYLLFGSRSRRFEESRESPGRPHERFEQVERFDPSRLVPVEPAGDLRTLLSVRSDDRIAVRCLLVLEMEERLPLDHGEQDGPE